METIIDFDTVSYTWPGGKGLHDVRLAVPRGALVLVAGPSGSGKSTLLRLAARLEEPDSGSIRFAGQPLADYEPPRLRRRIGYIQQTPVVMEGSVRENLLLPYSFAVNKEEPVPADEELNSWLQRVALDGVRLDDAATALSVGQKQRLCIIRSLLLRPELLLMDEPTSALDRESRRIVEELTETLNREGMTIIMVTHSDYRPQVAHTGVMVREGRLAFCDLAAEVTA
ncbi:ATP-binding cassette domain-containing protein [Desulfovibrio mangrovi]|uniref:ABC transporter ATP-binding protein n=1 Tax=Desulfovibrio mangrovi TaxID=2976983 RepID=UPI002246C7F1|nr:ATP-binding cassette domain-containing protein [Desulfovibrio mangrovi]UZP66124.1 ATP-binding cassette domain-containing protein [Desulfovibrio mangrovi]